MKIAVVGGGSGGHITPTLAVAAEVKRQVPSADISYIIGRNDKLGDVVQGHELFSSVHHIYSGKFRRYHGSGLLQVLDLPTTLKNIRDMVYVLIGIVQAFFLLRKLRPDVIFIKGGFVGVPVGLAAASLKIPYITHDSDILPGLANRIIGRWASWHAVAMPKEHYTYPAGRIVQVGIPVSDKYRMITASAQKEYKQSFGLPSDAQVILVTGGGLGAHRLNMAITAIAKHLLARHPKAVIMHISGRGKEEEVTAAYQKALKPTDLERIVLEPFVEDLYRYSGAADVIITRAGATTLAEFALQAKACIVVPNPILTGGHQTKNSNVLEDLEAIEVVTDAAVTKNPELLLQQVEALLDDPRLRLTLARNLHATAIDDASTKIAELITKSAQQSAARSNVRSKNRSSADET